MERRFDYFVVFAEMRTGSNFLETNLNAFSGLFCHGELFNPHFIGHQGVESLFGMNMADRAADPDALLDRAIAAEQRLVGFRFFHDHDPRILERCLSDGRCGKVVLTRNPVDSYVSLKIARATGQWKLTNVTRHKAATAEFDAAEFEQHFEALQAFQIMLLNRLQVAGQSAFYLDYDDLGDVEVLNGLARYLGHDGRVDSLARNLKKQNPEPLAEKVSNFPEMVEALARLDRFNLARTPSFEPRRSAALRDFRALQQTPLLYMPIPSAPGAAVERWLAALDGDASAPIAGFTRRGLADWLGARPDRRCFTVLRHPLLRAYVAFRDIILAGRFAGINDALRRNYGLVLAPGAGDEQRRADFLGFLRFLKGNLAGQSAVRVDAAWASQSAHLRAMGEALPPDLILREEDLPQSLPALGRRWGKEAPFNPETAAADELRTICDAEIEEAARAAYGRDYAELGFGPWTP